MAAPQGGARPSRGGGAGPSGKGGLPGSDGRKGPRDPGGPRSRTGGSGACRIYPARKQDETEGRAGRRGGKLPFKEQIEEGVAGEGREGRAGEGGGG